MAKKPTGSSSPPDDASPQDVAPETDAEVQSAAERVEAARQQLQAAEALLEQAREKAVQRVAWLRDRSAGELIDVSLEFVRKHPGLGVLTAASLGYFFGRLFRR